VPGRGALGPLLLVAAACGCGSHGAVTDNGDGGTGSGDAGSDVPLPPIDAGPATARWYGFYGDGAFEDGRSVAVDAQGNVAFAGYFQGTVNFGGTALVASGMSSDVFVAKFDSSGKHLWSERFGDNNLQVATGVAFDPTGDILVTGVNMGTLDFGIGAPLVSAGAEDIFVAKLDPTGKALWAKDFGDPSSQLAQGVASDTSGNVAIVGSFEGSFSFGGAALTSAGMYDVYVAKLDPTGAPLWSKSYGDAANQFGFFGAFDTGGDLAFTGSNEGTLDLGGGPLTSAGKKDAYVAKVDATGKLVFGKLFGDGSDQLGDCVAFDPGGNLLWSGGMEGTVDFGKGPIAATPDGGKFLVKLDATGATVWAHGFGDGNVYDWTGLTVDRSGNATVAGEFWNTIMLGMDMLTAKDRYDIFVASFDPEGRVLWDARYGANNDQFARTVAADPAGNVAMGGYFLGRLGFTSGAGMDAPFNGLLYLAELAP
jgi:hypothetical protein